MDKITIKRIKKAHPSIRKKLLRDYFYCNGHILGKGVRLRFSWVYRTDEEQDKLYAKKPKVTNAKGGQSIHNYGLAFDIVLLYDKNLDGRFEEASWDMMRDGDGDGVADWMEVIRFFRLQGYEWGGDWKSFKDYPHFQVTNGYVWRDLKRKKEIGDVEFDSDSRMSYVKL